MLREKEVFLIRLMKFSDAVIIFLSFILAYFISLGIRDFFNLGPLAFAPELSLTGASYFLLNHVWLVLIAVPAWITLMSVDDVYENFRTKLFIEILWRILRTGAATLLFIGSGIFLFKMTLTSRLYIAVFVVTAYLALAVEKAFWRWILDYTFQHGNNLVNLLIVGTGPRAREFVRVVRDHSNWGLKIVGLIDDDPKLLGQKIQNYEVIGRIRDIPRLLHDHVIDRVIFVVPRMWLSRIEETIHYCEQEGISTAISVDLYQTRLAKTRLSNFAGIPLILFQTRTIQEWQLFVKRLIDVVFSFLAIVILLPLFIVVAIGIKLTSPGPIFYKQNRCGMNGRKFTLYKFRSMAVGADRKRQALADANMMNGPVFKIKLDPRVTKFGRFLRKFSIDEYPQLFNVLKGDMSLVGPRPPLPEEVEMYERWQRRRLSMKPGITCIWQVSGRNKIDFDKWMEMDLQYIDNFSIRFDFMLLIRTFFVVITGYGAS